MLITGYFMYMVQERVIVEKETMTLYFIICCLGKNICVIYGCLYILACRFVIQVLLDKSGIYPRP